MKITTKQLKKIIKEELKRLNENDPFTQGTLSQQPRRVRQGGRPPAAALGGHAPAGAQLARGSTEFDPLGYSEAESGTLPGAPGSEERERALESMINHQVELQHDLVDLKDKLEGIEDQISDLRTYVGGAMAAGVLEKP